MAYDGQDLEQKIKDAIDKQAHNLKRVTGAKDKIIRTRRERLKPIILPGPVEDENEDEDEDEQD